MTQVTGVNILIVTVAFLNRRGMLQLDIRAMWQQGRAATAAAPVPKAPPASPPKPTEESEMAGGLFVICAPVARKESLAWPPLQAGAQCAVVYV